MCSALGIQWWVEAAVVPLVWNLQAARQRHLPNDYTDESYIINWDKGSESKQHGSVEKYSEATVINAI